AAGRLAKGVGDRRSQGVDADSVVQRRGLDDGCVRKPRGQMPHDVHAAIVSRYVHVAEMLAKRTQNAIAAGTIDHPDLLEMAGKGSAPEELGEARVIPTALPRGPDRFYPDCRLGQFPRDDE